MSNEIKAELLSRGNEKHYGTRIQLKNGKWDLGNALKVWYCADNWDDGSDGADKPEPSERETTDEWRWNDHYETKVDLEVARTIVERINNYPKLLEAARTMFEELKAHKLPIEDRVCRLMKELENERQDRY